VEVARHTPDWIALEGAVNARAVVPRVLLRADNLQALTAGDVRTLVEEHALEVVVDLRTDMEIEQGGPGPLSAERGVRIEHRSLYPDLAGDLRLDPSAVKPWETRHEDPVPEEAPVVRTYMGYLAARPDSVVGVVRAIARAKGSVLVHCAAGKDRTGVAVALALDAALVEHARIVADYVATAERIDAIIARLSGSPLYRADLTAPDRRRHTPVRETMERVLELIQERHGGSAAWLTANGLDERDLQRLRGRLPAGRHRASGL